MPQRWIQAFQKHGHYSNTIQSVKDIGLTRKFMDNVADAAKIAEFKYPSDCHTVVFLFDHSSCHRAFVDDALNSRKMNVKPGGQQPVMRDTTCSLR